MRRALLLAASLIVSAIFLWLALRDVPLTDVIDGIRQADGGWLILSLIGVFASLAGRAVLWRGLLDNRLSLAQAFHILNISMLLNLLPLRAGEVARSLLATRSGIPVVTAATSVVVERLLDIVAVVLMLVVAVSRLPSAPAGTTQVAALFGAAAVIGFIVLIAFARYPQVADRLLIWLENRLPALRRLNGKQRMDEVLDGLRPLTERRRAVHALVWTIISWAASLATFYALERALSIRVVAADSGDAPERLAGVLQHRHSGQRRLDRSLRGRGARRRSRRRHESALGDDPRLSLSRRHRAGLRFLRRHRLDRAWRLARRRAFAAAAIAAEALRLTCRHSMA